MRLPVLERRDVAEALAQAGGAVPADVLDDGEREPARITRHQSVSGPGPGRATLAGVRRLVLLLGAATAAVAGLAAASAAGAPSPLPRPLMIADRNNNRIIVVTADKRILWQVGGLRQPDDAFFTPGGRSVITNEEFDDTLVEVALPSGKQIWRYGHSSVPGSSPGYLNSPDDAYRLPNGDTTVADIKNCRIVQLTPKGTVRRILGGSCTHDPPRGFASPNGDTPLPDGGLLVTEIGGWIDRLDARGRLVWSVRSPVSYPSDAQLLPGGRILVAGFTTPGRIVILDRAGRITWSFGDTSGPNRLDRPSLAIMLPNGIIAATDDWNHRVILIDPKTKRIVWQYGHTGVPGSAPGYLSKPDGMDLTTPAIAQRLRAARAHG